MIYCKHCGIQLHEDVHFCPNCGTPINPEPFRSIFNTPDWTKDYEAYDVKSGRNMCFFAYLSWLLLIPLFRNLNTNSPYIRFHTNQGLLILILNIGIAVTQQVLRMACNMFLPFLNFLPNLLDILYAPCIVFSILGLVNVYQNRAQELPIIGKYRVLKHIIGTD